jgi:hypothetical protein
MQRGRAGGQERWLNAAFDCHKNDTVPAEKVAVDAHDALRLWAQPDLEWNG